MAACTMYTDTDRARDYRAVQWGEVGRQRAMQEAAGWPLRTSNGKRWLERWPSLR